MKRKGLIWDTIERHNHIEYDKLVTLIKDTIAPDNKDIAYKVEDDVNKAMADMFNTLELKYNTAYVQKKNELVRAFRKELIKRDVGFAFSKEDNKRVELVYCGEKQTEWLIDVYLDDEDTIIVHTQFVEDSTINNEWTRLTDFSNDEIEAIIDICLTPRKILPVQMGEDVDWMSRFGVYARNRDTRMFENVTEFAVNSKVVLYDWQRDDFDENAVANDLANAITNDMWDGEDYTLYNCKHELVGFVYQVVEEK